MRRHFINSIILLVGLFVLTLSATVALAGQKNHDKETKNNKHLILGDEFDNITINADGPELTITMTENGKSKVTIVDMEQVGLMLGETMSEVTQALSEMQMEFRVGNDNSMTFALAEDEWEVDFNALMAEVGQALEGAFEDLDTDDWHHHRHQGSVVEQDTGDIDDEMAELRQELKNLKKELAQLKKLKAEGSSR